MHHLSLPVLKFPLFSRAPAARKPGDKPRLSSFWIAVPAAVLAVAVLSGVLLVQKPAAAQAVQEWLATATMAESGGSDR